MYTKDLQIFAEIFLRNHNVRFLENRKVYCGYTHMRVAHFLCFLTTVWGGDHYYMTSSAFSVSDGCLQQTKNVLPYSINHSKSHIDTIGCMLRPADRQATDTVVTITQDLDPHALVLLREK